MKGPADRRGLDPRSRELLRTLIAQHIRDGEPVGSRTLARASGLDVSAATIRNIMADLEDMGLLSAPPPVTRAPAWPAAKLARAAWERSPCRWRWSAGRG